MQYLGSVCHIFCRIPSLIFRSLVFRSFFLLSGFLFIKEKPQIYQGFSAPTEPTKTLEKCRKNTHVSKDIPCLELTKEIRTTKERKDRVDFNRHFMPYGPPLYGIFWAYGPPLYGIFGGHMFCRHGGLG